MVGQIFLVILFSFIVLSSLFLVLSFICDNFSFLDNRGRKILCDILGWHNGKHSAKVFDGKTFYSKCSRCGKDVMQDSQGDWI